MGDDEDEDFLGGVGGGFRVGAEAQGEPVDQVLEFAAELFEGVGVTGDGLGGQTREVPPPPPRRPRRTRRSRVTKTPSPL
ncbi:hypothetical protein, partial [Nocardia otitidiscaviarum]|uniref:hypothetical protein n=1 Tax=Nocardia otitidiscaviarum TaxID=1823 RepID=UPI002454FF65